MGPRTSLSVAEGASPQAAGIVIAAVGGAISFWSPRLGAGIAALGAVQWLLMPRTRWIFDRSAGTAARLTETGVRRTLEESFPLAEIMEVILRRRVRRDPDEPESHDLLLARVGGRRSRVLFSVSPSRAERLAGFLEVPILREEAAHGGSAGLEPDEALPVLLRALRQEKGLRGFLQPKESLPFFESLLRQYSDDPDALRLLAAGLAAGGERGRAASLLDQATVLYRARGDVSRAEETERHARRLGT